MFSQIAIWWFKMTIFIPLLFKFGSNEQKKKKKKKKNILEREETLLGKEKIWYMSTVKLSPYDTEF